MRFDNPVVWKRLVELAGGPGSRFAVMSMAAGRPERAATLAQQALQRAGARTDWVAVAPALKDQDLAAAVRDPQWLQMVATSQAVFFTGVHRRASSTPCSPEARTALCCRRYGLCRPGAAWWPAPRPARPS